MKTILLTIIAAFIFLSVSAQTTYVVFKPGDPDPYKYPYNFDDAKCDPVMYGTLQWAIRKSLDTPGECLIVFNIPGTGPFTISLNYSLPIIEKEPITIDATSQPGYSIGNPQIILDGNYKQLTGMYFNNIKNSGVKGVVFKHFISQAIIFNFSYLYTISDCYFTENGSIDSRVQPAAIRIVNSTYGNIKGNFVGVDPQGNETGNNAYGIVMSDFSDNNTIGGTNLNEGNVIVKNYMYGLWITKGSRFNKISGNIIYGQERAIVLTEGNNMKHAPGIGDYKHENYTLKGSSDPNDIIEIFGGTLNQDVREYITTVQADSYGNWIVQASTNYSEYFATATDIQNNTSDLSVPFHAPILITSLKSTDCDISDVMFSQVLMASPVFGADQYEFNISEPISGLSENIVKATNNFSLSELNMTLQLNTAYSISVRTKIGELWGQFGNTCKVTTVKSTTIQACTDETLHHTCTVTSAGDPVHITVNLPNGIYGLNNASTIPPATIQIDTTNPSVPEYIFNAPSTSFTFNYHVLAGCETFSASTQNIHFTIDQDGVITNDSFYLSTPYIVFYPTGSQNITFNNAFINIPFTRIFAYKNTGNTFTGDFLFQDTTLYDVNNTAIKIINIESLSPNATIVQSIIADTSCLLKLNITNLKTDSIILLRETVMLVDCQVPDNNISHFNSIYGCSNDSLCMQVQSQTDVTVTNEDANDKPNILNEILNLGYQSCWSDTLVRVMRVVNNGGGIATSVYIGVINGNAPYNKTPNLTDHPISEFEVYKIIGGVEIPIPVVTTTPLYSNNEAIVTMDSLYPNDTIYIRYLEIINCIDSVNYDSYFNHTTYMHWEGFPWIQLNHPCNSVYRHYPFNNNYYNATWRRDFSLNQVFNNLIGAMPDGDVEWFHVASSSLQLGNQWGGVIFDMHNSELIVELDLEPGLGLVDSNLFLSSVYNVTNLYPTSIEFIPGPNNFANGNKIIAKFNFPDSMFIDHLTHYSGFDDQLEPSFFNYFNNFNVNFQLYADCQFASDTPSTITQKVFFNPNNTCADQCIIPLSKVEDDIFILCPGCVLPGWNLSSFNITRTNLGYADDNNNNFPDSYPLQPANPSLAQIHNAIIGDTLEFDISGNTSDGGYIFNSSGDSIFVGFNNIGFEYKYGQMQLLFPMFDKLRYLEATGTISDNNGTYPFVLPATTGNLYSGGFTISLDIDTLQQYGVPSTFNRFWANNSLTIKPVFVVDSNLIDNTAPNPYYSIQGVDARMNMSGTPFPQGIEILTDAGTFVQASPDSFIAMTGSQRDSLNYWCTGWNGRFGAIGVDYNFYDGQSLVTHSTYFDNYHPCNNVLHFYTYTEVGHQVYGGYGDQFGEQVPWNSFSYEIRNLWMLDSLQISFPPYFYLDTVVFATTQLTSSNGVTQYTCTPWANNPGTWHIYDMTDTTATDTTVTIYPARNFEQITSSIGCNGVSHHRLTAYDETKRYRIYFILRSDSCGPPYVDTTYHRVISYWSDFPTSATGDTTINQKILGTFQKPDATLNTQVNLPVIQDMANSDLTINMQVGTYSPPGWNFGDYDASIKHMIAENTFIMFHSPSGNFIVDSVINIQTNNHVPVVNTVLNDSVYGLGSVGFGWGNKNIRIFGSYDCANITGKDSVLLFSGWNCKGYPGNLNEICYLDSQWISFTVLKPGLQATLNISDTLNICDTLHYDLLLTSTGVGNVHNVTINIPIPQSGEFDYQQGSAFLLYNGNNTPVNNVIIGVDTLSFNLSTPGLLDNFEQQTAHFIFNILPSCSFYSSQNEVQLYISAENYCGNEIDIPVISDRPDTIIGLPVQDSLLVNISVSDTLSGCGDSTLVTVTITNTGTSYTGNNDSLFVVLPSSFAWAGGDMYLYNSGQTLVYPVDSGLIQNASQTIQFYVSGISTGGSYPVIANVSVAQSYPCNNNTCIFAQDTFEASDSTQIIVVPIQVSITTTDASCNGVCDGTATVSCSGVAPFTYYWSTGGNSISENNLCTGNHYVTVTDANGCSDSLTFVINELPGVVLSTSFTNPYASLCNGTASVTATSGIAPYTYLWTGNFTTQEIDSLCPGTYSVIVTDSIGCTDTATVVLTDQPFGVTLTASDPCYADNGYIISEVIPGGSTYTYSWSNSAISSEIFDLAPGTYSVTVTDVNTGNTATASITLNNYALNCSTVADVHIYSSLPWSSNAVICHNVIIHTGATLSIDLCTLQFAPGKGIVVLAGGNLILNHATLTSACPKVMWAGIYSIHYGTGSSITLADSAVIENAERGIYAKGNVYVNCYSSVFRNNYVDINLTQTTFLHHIEDNDFKTDAAPCHYPHFNPYIHIISLDNLVDQVIKLNKFSNLTPYNGQPQTTERSVGIYSNHNINIAENNFDSLYCGVLTYNPVTLEGDTFVSNTYGAVITGSSSLAIIKNNVFTVGHMGGIYPNDPSTTWPRGLHIENCPAYEVQDNIFKDGYLGMILRNNITGSMIIYRNNFDNLDYPAVANFNNNVKFTCNNFGLTAPNVNTNILTFFGSITSTQDHAIIAANPQLPPYLGASINTHNRFANPLNIFATDVRKFNIAGAGWMLDYDYYQFDFDNTNINPTPYDGADTLPPTNLVTTWSNVPYDQINCDLQFTKSSISSKLNEIGLMKDDETVRENLYLNLVDGNNTDYFLNYLSDLKPNNFNNLYNQLMNNTPFISDTVLISFMVNPINKPAHKKTVVTACSPLPLKVRPYIDQMNINQNFKDQLWALQTGDNSKTAMEKEILNRNYSIGLTFCDLFLNTVNDTLEEKTDSLLDYVLNSGNLNERIIANPTFLSRDRFSDAGQNLTSINALNVNLPENRTSQIIDYIELQTLSLQMAQVNDSIKKSIIGNNLNFIQAIATDSIHFCQADAIALLEQYYDTIFPRMVYLGDLNNYGNTKMFFSKKQVSETCMLEVSPNPVNDILNLKIDRNADEAKYDICIYNSNGTIIKVIVFNTNETIKQLDVSHYPPGNYFVSLQNKNEVLCVKSIIVE